MKRIIASFIALLLLVGGVLARAKDSTDECRKLDEKTVELIGRYKELREQRGRLAAGTFDKDVHADGGSLSVVLSALGAALGHPPYTKQTIVRCLGKPDAIRDKKRMAHLLGIYHNELRKAGRKIEERDDREYLIYFWRGWHDFLFFIVEDGVIVDHGWWFAYE